MSSSRPLEAADDAAAPAGEARDGRSTRWDPHRRERRLTIINAAIAVIEEHGSDVLTAQIAEQAGVPRTHVYRHFEGKTALDLAVSTHVAREIGVQIRAGLARGSTPRTVIRAAIDEHLAWIEAHPNLYRFLAQHAYAMQAEGQSEPTAADAKAVLAAELTDLVQRYLGTLGMPARNTERLVVGAVGLVDATAAWWLDRRDPPRPALCDELTERVVLILARSAAELGVDLDPDRRLPAL